MTRIWVVEDDATLRLAYEHWLEKTIEDVEITTFPSVERADEALRSGILPGALVVDHHLPGELGLDWLLRRRQRARSFGSRAVLVTGDPDPVLSARAAVHGIHVILKPQTPFWLPAFLSGRHDISIPPAAVRGSLPEVVARHARKWGLTSRRAEIVRLAVDGLRGDEIARELGVRPATVKTQVRAILKLAGCANMRELVELILRAQRGG